MGKLKEIAEETNEKGILAIAAITQGHFLQLLDSELKYEFEE